MGNTASTSKVENRISNIRQQAKVAEQVAELDKQKRSRTELEIKLAKEKLAMMEKNPAFSDGMIEEQRRAVDSLEQRREQCVSDARRLSAFRDLQEKSSQQTLFAEQARLLIKDGTGDIKNAARLKAELKELAKGSTEFDDILAEIEAEEAAKAKQRNDAAARAALQKAAASLKSVTPASTTATDEHRTA